MADNQFSKLVESLLAKGQMYQNPEQFALNLGLLLVKHKEKALQLLDGMLCLAKKKTGSKNPRERKRYRRWLVDLAKYLDVYQIRDRSWIELHVHELPKLPTPKEQTYNPEEGRQDIRLQDDPNLERVCYLEEGDISRLLQSPEESVRTPDYSIDLCQDPQILLGTPSPTKSAQELPMEVEILGVSGKPTSSGVQQADKVIDKERAGCPPNPDFEAEVRAVSTKQRVTAGCHSPEHRPRRREDRGSHRSKGQRRDSREERRVVSTGCAVDRKRRSSTQETLTISVPVPAKKRKFSRDSLSELRQSLENQRRRDRRKKKVTCCVPDCEDEGVVYQKVHAMTCHVPTVFDSRISNPDEKVQSLRVKALLQVATWLLGRPGSIQELVELVNRQHCLEGYEPVTPSSSMWPCMTSFCVYLNQSVPEKFSLEPLNSVASLLHWKVLYMLSALLEAEDREYWKCRFAMPEGVTIGPAAVDSHFHADRLQTAAQLQDGNMKQILALGGVEPSRTVRLVGAVANFCDPDTFPVESDLASCPAEVIVSVGIHPKHASRSRGYVSEALKKLSRLLLCPRVSAIGEVGLDHSVRDTYWSDQMSLLRKVVPLVPADKVLVLHCRAIPGNNGIEVHQLLLRLLRSLPRDQKIHLHSFKGSSLIANWWLEAFPETCFSFNRGVQHFSEEQVAALVELDESRVLLETDAPYFNRRGRGFSAPLELYDVAEMVASHRGVSTEYVLAVTKENALRLYGKIA